MCVCPLNPRLALAAHSLRSLAAPRFFLWKYHPARVYMCMYVCVCVRVRGATELRALTPVVSHTKIVPYTRYYRCKCLQLSRPACSPHHVAHKQGFPPCCGTYVPFLAVAITIRPWLARSLAMALPMPLLPAGSSARMSRCMCAACCEV